MADKGLTIPMTFVVDEKEFERRLTKAISSSGKEIEKKYSETLARAFNTETEFKKLQSEMAKLGHLPEGYTEKMYKNLEKSAKAATKLLDTFNKIQEDANLIPSQDMFAMKDGKLKSSEILPLYQKEAEKQLAATGQKLSLEEFVERHQQFNDAAKEAFSNIQKEKEKLSELEGQLGKLKTQLADVQALQDKNSGVGNRGQMVDIEYDIVNKYEKYQKLLESSERAIDRYIEKVRKSNLETHNLFEAGKISEEERNKRLVDAVGSTTYKRFDTQRTNARNKMSEMQEEYDKAVELLGIRERLEEQGFINPETDEVLKDVNAEMQTLISNIETLTGEATASQANVDQMIKAFDSPDFAKYKPIGVSDFEVDKVDELALAFASTANAANNANNSIKNTKDTTKDFRNELVGMSKALLGDFTKVFKMIGKVISRFKQFGKQSTRAFTEGQPSLKKMFNMVLRYGFGIRSIFFLVKRLKKTIVDDFNVMAQSIPEVNKQLSELSTSWLKLKATLGTLAQPLLQYFGPAINWIINKVQELMVVWAKFIALLTGQKYIYTAQTAMVDYAKSIGDAAGAAKDLNKQLAPFDKLNVLNSDNKSGGGSGSSPTEINTDNVKYLKEDLEDIDNIFYEMGKRSAQMFNDIMNSLDWKAIKEKAKEYATNITDYIWGWVDTFDFAKFGQTLAEGINTIFTFIKTFVETMPWSEIGEGIGTSITNFFDTLDIETISDGIAGAINGAVNLVAGLLKETDFKKIGTKIGEFLSKTFKKINWKKLGSTLKDLIVGLATVVVNTMKAIDWEEVGHGIRDCLEELFDGDPNPLVAVGEALWTCLQSAIELKHAMFDGHPIANFVTDALILLFTVGPIVGRLMNIGTAIMGLIGTGMTTAAATTAVTTAASTAAASATTAAAAGATTAATAAGSAAGGAMVLGMVAGVAAAAAGGATLGYAFDKYALDTHGIGIDNWYQKAQDESKAAAQEWAEETQADAVEYWNTGLQAAADELEGFDALLNIGEGLSETGGINEEWTETIDDIEKGLRKIAAAGVDLGDTEAVLEFIADPFNDVGFGQYSNAAKYVEMISEQWDGLSISAQAALLNLDPDKYTEVLNEIAGEYSSTANSIEESNNSIFDNIASVFEALTSTADEQIGALSTIFGDLKSSLTDVFNGIIGGSEAMGNGVTDGLNQVSDSLNSMSFTLPDWLPDVGGKSLNFNLPRLGKVSIPRLAQGGVIPANNEFLAVLGDQKQGTNIEAPLDTIKQAFAEVLTQMNTNSSKDGDIIINIDGEEVFRVVRDQDRIFKKSTGRSAFA